MSRFLFSLVVLVSVVCSSTNAMDLNPDQKADKLAWQIDAGAEQVTWQRQSVGIGLLSSGAFLGGAGGVMLASANRQSWRDAGTAALAVGGAFFLSGGLLMLLHLPQERRADQLFASAAGTVGAARLAAYEKILERLAEDERARRVVQSAVGMVLGAGICTAGLVAGRDSSTISLPLLTALGAGAFAGSVLELFLPGFYQAKWESYRRNGALAGKRPWFEFGVGSLFGRGGRVIAALSF